MVTVVYYERPLHCHSTCRRDRLVCPSDHKRLRRDLSVSASFPRSQLGPDLRLHWSLPPPHWTHKWKPVQCSPDPTETHTMTMTILNCLQFLKLKWAAHQSVTFLLTQLPELSSLWPLLWPLLWSLFGLSFNLSFDLSLASPEKFSLEVTWYNISLLSIYVARLKWGRHFNWESDQKFFKCLHCRRRRKRWRHFKRREGKVRRASDLDLT